MSIVFTVPSQHHHFNNVFYRHFSEETLESAGHSLHHLVTFFVIYMGCVCTIFFFLQLHSFNSSILTVNSLLGLSVVYGIKQTTVTYSKSIFDP